MLLGVAVGYLFKHRQLSFIPKVITLLIWFLLFILGIQVGSNSEIVKSLHLIGLDAFMITLAAVIGSLLSSWLLWRYVMKTDKNKGDER